MKVLALCFVFLLAITWNSVTCKSVAKYEVRRQLCGIPIMCNDNPCLAMLCGPGTVCMRDCGCQGHCVDPNTPLPP